MPLKAFPLIFKRLFQGIGGLLMGKKLVAGGQALAAGLYAIGNTAANIFGKVYPGAGGTICQGLVYGYIVAQHAAGTEFA